MRNSWRGKIERWQHTDKVVDVTVVIKDPVHQIQTIHRKSCSRKPKWIWLGPPIQ